MQEHELPHILPLQMPHLLWDLRDPQIPLGHQKPYQKQGWTEFSFYPEQAQRIFANQ